MPAPIPVPEPAVAHPGGVDPLEPVDVVGAIDDVPPSTDAGIVASDLSAGMASGSPPEPLATEPDWLDRICPYLLSEEGTYRSSQPDPGHRCTAQDPPSPLPTAFQERFCLTERHVRCEMYKLAQSARAAALGDGGIPADQVRSARFRPSVRSIPLALGPSRGVQQGTAEGSRRPILLAAIGIGAVAMLVFILVLILGGGGPGGSAGGGPSPSPLVTVAPPTEAPPTASPAAAASDGPVASSAASPGVLAGFRMAEYQVQEGEALLAISETFGVTRRQIILANEGMADMKPYTQTDQVIRVPIGQDLTAEQIAAIEALPGFLGYLE